MQSSNLQIFKSSNPQILKSSNPQILKSSKSSVKTFVKLSSIFLLLNHTAYAAEIIGNLTVTYAATTSLLSSRIKAVSFQMGAQAFTLDNVKIVLKENTGTETSAQTVVELRSHDGTNTPISTTIATLNPNPLTNTAYGITPTVATFTPASTITLAANTKYWVIVRSLSTTGYLNWVAPSSNSAPGNVAGTYLSYSFSNDSGSSWGSSTSYNAIQINGTAVSNGIVNAPIDLHFSKQVESYSTEIELK